MKLWAASGLSGTSKGDSFRDLGPSINPLLAMITIPISTVKVIRTFCTNELFTTTLLTHR